MGNSNDKTFEKKVVVSNAVNELQKLMDAAVQADDEEEESFFVVEEPSNGKSTETTPTNFEKTLHNGDLQKKDTSPDIKPKKKRKKKQKVKPKKLEDRTRKDGTPFKQRRYRPGTIAIRNIRKYQRSENLLTAKAVIRRTIKRHLEKYTGDVRLGAGSVECIQQIVEDEIVKMTECSQLIRFNCGNKITITKSDALVYQQIRFKNIF